jgi:hypothetical protein
MYPYLLHQLPGNAQQKQMIAKQLRNMAMLRSTAQMRAVYTPDANKKDQLRMTTEEKATMMFGLKPSQTFAGVAAHSAATAAGAALAGAVMPGQTVKGVG